MPLDAIYLSALTAELREKLEGGRIDKVQQPERDMLLISLRSAGENLRLLMSAGTGRARVHLTEHSFENPAEPPMFCMLLRKHLLGARIVSVYQPEYERMLVLELEGRDEMGFPSSKKLVAELIGRSSNIILVGGDGRIIDCMRRMDFGGDSQRRMLPGMIYRMPPAQEKPALLKTDSRQRRAMIEAADKSQSLDKWLLNSFVYYNQIYQQWYNLLYSLFHHMSLFSHQRKSNDSKRHNRNFPVIDAYRLFANSNYRFAKKSYT